MNALRQRPIRNTIRYYFLPALLMASMSCGGAEKAEISPEPEPGVKVGALNLESGEHDLFADKDKVPPGWGICSDTRCSVPPQLPCHYFGSGACLLNDACQLKLLCEFDISLDGDGAFAGDTPDEESRERGEDATPDERSDSQRKEITREGTLLSPDFPISPRRLGGCELTCRPSRRPVPEPPQPPEPPYPLPEACSDIRDKDRCTATLGCEFQPIVCVTTPCPAGICQAIDEPIGPLPCEVLDAATCRRRREDCMWTPGICPAIACREGEDCDLRCRPFCQPTEGPITVDPPCPVVDFIGCPPGLEAVTKYDDYGCEEVRCEKAPVDTSCDEAASHYRKIVDSAKFCDPRARNLKCRDLVPESLSACPVAYTAINDSRVIGQLDAIRTRWNAECAPDLATISCLAIEYPFPKRSFCDSETSTCKSAEVPIKH